MGKRVRITKRILFFTAIAAFLFLIWKLDVSTGKKPLEQRTEDGWFEGMDSPIRDIRLYVETQYWDRILEAPEFEVWIQDAAGNKIWESSYENLSLTDGEFVILEEYELGDGIVTGKGKFRICDTLVHDDSIRVNYRVFNYEGGYGRFYLVCSVTALVFLAVVLGVTMQTKGKYRLAVNYLIAFLLMGILYSLIMPPLSVPDEEGHFRKAYVLSSKLMMQDYGLMRKTDNDNIIYLQNAAGISRWYAAFHEKADLTETVNMRRTSVPDTTPSYTYLFAALGIIAARICRVNGHWLILMGRMFNLLGVSLLLTLAVHLMPVGKRFVCVAALLPEVVYLASSYSYDALNYALCFLAIAYFFHMTDGEKRIRLSNIAVFAGIVLIMVPIKLVYAPILGLLLLIPKERLEIQKINKKILFAVGVLAVAAGCYLLLYRGRDIIVLLKGLAYNERGENNVSLNYMLQHPTSVMFVFVNNIRCNFDYYVKSMIGEFVGRDRRGVRLDTAYLPLWMNMVFGILLALGIYEDGSAGLKKWKKIWVILIGGGTCFLIFLSMYLANNMVGEQTIHGVQGRYFLPLLLLLPTLLGNGKRERGEEQKVLSTDSYMILAFGMDMLAIFVQLQHLTMGYYT